MKIPHRLLLFTGSVLLPGFTLAYLSFRSVKDERLLLEKSLESRHRAFADAAVRLLIDTRASHLERLRDQLRRGGSADIPERAWSLGASLLENPLVQSVAVFRGDSAAFPRISGERVDAAAAPEPPRATREIRAAAASVHQDWRLRRYGPCLRSVRQILSFPDGISSIFGGSGEMAVRFGFRLLELKCLVRLGEAAEAIALGQSYIRDLQATGSFDSYQTVGFYLFQAVELLTSLETLPREERAGLFDLHQRLPLFLSNADLVQRTWPAPPEELLHAAAFSGDSLKPEYHEGAPYLRVGFPWLAQGTQVLLHLDEGVFVEALRAEMLPEGRTGGGWKDIDFAVLNRRDEIMLASDSLADRVAALDRSLEEFPAWRVIVYQKPAGELQSLGRQRIALQYTLLLFSLLVLLLGAWTLFRGLDQERRMVHMKANFLSAVSHELKTPLTAIRMFAEMLSSGRQAQEEKKRQYVQRIGDEAERLQGMIEGILSYTRLEEDPRALRFAEIDLGALAEECAALLDGAFAKAGIRLSVRSAPARFQADYEALRSVVQNLLENALKYSRPGGEVTLEVRDAPDRVTLRVADQGIGIPAADLKHIFEKFYRAGDEMTRKTRGSGLGLALVKRIVDAHGGTIQARSAVNQGTEMIITFAKEGGPRAPDSHR